LKITKVGGATLSNLIYYALLGALIGFIINYLDISAKKGLVLAIVIGALAGILSTYIF
jgi:F0F1-type ATP synthase assembly protein I